MDYDVPLRWEHEDGRTGTEVRGIPCEGMVFFYDDVGPLARFADIAEARWWCLIKRQMREGGLFEMRFRVTRLTDKDGGKHYLLPGFPGIVDCDDTHPCKGAHPCVVMDAMCNRIVEAAG